MDAGRRYETSGSETRDSILLTGINIDIGSSMLTTYASTLQKGTLLLGIFYNIMGSKQTRPFASVGEVS